MSFYTKDDMLYTDYDWNTTVENSPKLKGEADRTLFQCYQGNEILYLINHVAEKLELKDKTDGREMERLLHDHLPLAKMSQVTASKWLKEAFEKGKDIQKAGSKPASA